MHTYKIKTPHEKPARSVMLFLFWDLCSDLGIGESYGTIAQDRTWVGAWGEQAQIDTLLENLNRHWPGWTVEKDPPGAKGW